MLIPKTPIHLSPLPFRIIFKNIQEFGRDVSPRGLLVKEIENYAYVLGPYVRFCNFESRKLNLDYIKREFLWYLGADKHDLSILNHASMWRSLVNEDGSINSNYGQYWFDREYGNERYGSQYEYVIEALIADRDSRRASMMILQPKHLVSITKDYPCTYTLNFRIRENQLNMSVHMRSQDAVFGMGNDIPCFSFVHEMVFTDLLNEYPNLEMGMYHHIADSFHVYEKHFSVIDAIAGVDPYTPIDCPRMTIGEPARLLNLKNVPLQPNERERYPFAAWLTTFDKESK